MGEEPHLMGNVRAIFTGALHVHSLPHGPLARRRLCSLLATRTEHFLFSVRRGGDSAQFSHEVGRSGSVGWLGEAPFSGQLYLGISPG